MPHASKIAAALLALALGACAGPQVASVTGPIAVTSQTQGEVTAYLRKVKVTRPGAFAVSPDGRNSFYTYCEDVACFTSNYTIPALNGCQSLSGAPCLILYVRQDQRAPYSVDANLAPDGRHGSQEQLEIELNDNRR